MATSASPWEKYKPASAPAETASAAQEPASAAVAPPSSADQAAAKNDAAFDAGAAKLKEDYKEKTTRTGMSPVKVGDFEAEIPSFFLTAPGVVTASAALYGAGVGAKKGYDVAVSGGKKLYGSLRDMMGAKKEDGLLASQQADKAALAQSTPADVSAQTKPTTAFDTSTDIGKPFSKTDINLVEKGEINTGTNTVSKDVTANQKAMAKGIAEGLPAPDLTTGTGKPAYAGQSDEAKIKTSYASTQDVPKGYAFVPGAQNIDTVRQNVGQPTFTKEFAVRPYPQSYQAANEVSNEINRSMARPTRDQLIAEGKPFVKNTPGITEYASRLKLVKVAGVGGALVSIANLANAKQAAQTMGEAMLPIGMTPSEVQSGKIPALESKENQEQYLLSQPGNRAELAAMIKGKNPDEVNKIRNDYLGSAPTSDFDRASRLFRQQAAAKQGVPPPSMR